ncbi:GNAT family N-acetyltransferase (plasmid) [Mesorhizobium sp. AR02]|uniref:GNAT family N-acetyltransferase n=1 Tax=Mesorhizobium sp. AR02 TaxID=2865837 RepID=UPI00215DEDFA|nr:GNAT family N-acetyltransferase [Mesorhizobium sp. AR02]UVK50242.1 GNAT family N-acetyltransferase [Mesorhizobium sp. AR02]
MDQNIRRLVKGEIENDLSEEGKAFLGDLVYQALPELYDKVPIDRPKLNLILADQIDSPSTELSETWTLWEEGAILGLLSVVDAGELDASQRMGMLDIVRHLDRDARTNFKRALEGHGSNVETLASGEGKYLPRMAVAEAARGKGVARRLMHHVLDRYPNTPIYLHVANTNAIVIKLHKSLGFQFQSESDFPIRVLVRNPQ